MRRTVVTLALVFAPGLGCFVDSGLGMSGTTGEATTSSTGTVDATSTSTGTVDATTTGSPTEGGSTAEATGTSGDGTTGDGTTGAPEIPPCEGYYATEFKTDPALDWEVLLSQWTWDSMGGTYRGTSVSDIGAAVRLKTGTWGDVRVRARLRLAPMSFGGVVLRLADPVMGLYFYIQLDSTNGDVEGFLGTDMNAKFSFAKLAVAGEWMELDVSYVGDKVAVSLDGVSLTKGIQVGALAEGNVGMLALQGTMDVDAFFVCPP